MIHKVIIRDKKAPSGKSFREGGGLGSSLLLNGRSAVRLYNGINMDKAIALTLIALAGAILRVILWQVIFDGLE